MSFSDPSAPFIQQPPMLGLDGMGFWPQFPNEQSIESNSQFDHIPPPFKRAKNSDDMHLLNNNTKIPSSNPPINQPVGKIFFKTRLCAKFRMGQCRNGENCNFAHGEEDLRKPPPNWQELVAGRMEDRGNGSGSWEDDDNIIHKMKLCKKFYNGEECPYGDRCNFLHKEPPKIKDSTVIVATSTSSSNNSNNSARFREYCRDSAVISIGTTGSPDQLGLDVSRANSRPMYWKTRLCNRFEDTGHCGFGDKCQYAHGRAELLLPGGRPAESEPMAVISVPVKPAPPLANEVGPVKIETGGPSLSEREDVERKNILKWKLNKKINRIYGDWIDDLPLPNEIEN